MQSQIIEFANTFAPEDIPSGYPVFIEIHRYFNIYGEQHDVVLRLNKFLYGQAKSVRLWYKKFQNGLLHRVFVAIKVDPCLFMSNNFICMLYLDDFLFW